MLESIDRFTNVKAETLMKFLTAPERPEGTMTFFELEGFLFAVGCSPEFVPPSEWLPVVFNEGDAGYQSMDEAKSILATIMSLYNHIASEVSARQVTLPPRLVIEKDAIDNLDPGAHLCQWSRGFVEGHTWLQESWDQIVPDELDEELGSFELVLSFFADHRMAEAFLQEMMRKESTLDEAAATILPLIEGAMQGYAHLGRSIKETLAKFSGSEEEPGNLLPGRNDPCPCGSGKKFKKCCMN